MSFRIIEGDITKLRVDAIVNAANETLLGGGGVDGAIHRAAGMGLLKECMTLGGCDTGEAKLTGGYKLPSGHVIHTVGPVWHGGKNGEEELLRSCYRNSLEIASEQGFESIAFPVISAGVYGYPFLDAVHAASDEIGKFLETHEMEITLVVFDRKSFHISDGLKSSVESFIKNSLTEERRIESPMPRSPKFTNVFGKSKAAPLMESSVQEECFCEKTIGEADFELDVSFSEYLLKLIDEKGLTDPEVYRRANIDRKLFSKIRSNKDYRPSKKTAIAFAVALELDIDYTEELLDKAGFSLSGSILFDVIIRYFIENEKYDIFEINEVLFEYDQQLLGA